MIYKNYKNTDKKLSLLGFGCMRLPTVGGPGDPIDYEKAEALIDYAYAHGVNYFDTAYVYHGGDSERFIGKALSKYPRDTWNLVTKMPGFGVNTHEDVIRVFNEQLERAGVEYFDYYLCHGVNDGNMDFFTNKDIGVIPFLIQKKEEGKIKKLGFSSHCTPKKLAEFVELYDWDIAQIQLNYLDWDYQDAKQQYEILTAHGIPVVVMEPCRGGRLINLGEDSEKILKATAPDRTMASWAFRWQQGLDNVQVVLSGMHDMDQVVENVALFDEYQKLNEAEAEALENAKKAFLNKFTVPCTGCRYCSDCPRELDIPTILSAYNDVSITDNMWSRGQTVKGLLKNGDSCQPYECLGCGLCQSRCPQNIDTPKIMAEFAKLIASIPKEFK